MAAVQIARQGMVVVDVKKIHEFYLLMFKL
jgi:hypothetical protein